MMQIDDEWRDILDRHNIDPATVIDGQRDLQWHRMFRTKAAWPAGGTYEATAPRDIGDECVAERVSETVKVVVVGRHPDGQIRASEPGALETSELEFHDSGAWRFFDTKDTAMDE